MKEGENKSGKPARAPQSTDSPRRRVAIPYPPGYSARAAEEPQDVPHFSPREQEVGGYVAEEFTDGELAGELQLGLHGVKAHVKQLLRKTKTRGRG